MRRWQKVNKAVVDMANDFNLDVNADDLGELLEVVPKELSNELLKLEQELIAEEEAGKKETVEKKK